MSRHFLPLESHRGFQIVATIGPSSESLVEEIANAGATAFRVNASHVPPEHLPEALDRIRNACPGAPVVVDLQGAKMRVAAPAPLAVHPGEDITFHEEGGRVSIPHPELFRQAATGDTLAVDDGRLRFRVIGCAGGEIRAVSLDAGEIVPRKGVNLAEHPVCLSGLTRADRSAIEAARQAGASALAFSFMLDGREAEWLREAAPECAVIGKVERREAAAALEPLSRRVDAVWICRGDLGVQLGSPGMARLIAELAPPALGAPVLMAGQVLQHLAAHDEPTRSEVCHLYDLVARGYAGIVLSDETAIGHAPARAVSIAAGLVRSFEA